MKLDFLAVLLFVLFFLVFFEVALRCVRLFCGREVMGRKHKKGLAYHCVTVLLLVLD